MHRSIYQNYLLTSCLCNHLIGIVSGQALMKELLTGYITLVSWILFVQTKQGRYIAKMVNNEFEFRNNI